MLASRFKIVLCVLTVAVMASGALAQDCQELQGQARFLGSGEGRDYLGAVPVEGGRVLGITSEAQLVVLQQNPEGAPTEIGLTSLDAGDGWIAGIGQTVYVSGNQGVKIFQVQTGGSVAPLGYLPGQETAAEIKACGAMLAVAHDGAWSLWDCAVPSSPALLSRTEFTNSAPSFEMTHLALGSQNAVVNELVYDLADPTAPQPLPSLISGNGVVKGQEIHGPHLYQFLVSYTDGGSWIYGDRWFYRQYRVRVLDLSDTGNYPVLANHTFQSSTAFPLAAPRVVMSLSEGRVLAGQTHDPNLLVIDTTLPPDAVPYRVPVLPAPALTFQDEQLVGLGAKVFAFATPETMTPGTYPVPSVGTGGSYPYGNGYDDFLLFDTEVRGDLLAVSTGHNWSDGQFTWEESTTVDLYLVVDGALQNISSRDLSGQWDQIALGQDYLFLNASGLYSMDISDPANPGDPVQVSGFGTTYGLASLDGDLYAAGNSTGVVSVWNLADPTAPVLVGSCDLGDRAGRFVRDGQTILATFYYSPQVAVLDLSDPAVPQVVQFVDVPGSVQALTARDGRAVAITVEEGQRLKVDFDYQVAGSVEPVRSVETMAIPMSINSATWHGQQVFLGGSGLHAYDPDQTSFIGSRPTSHPYLGLVSFAGLHAVTVDGLLDVTEIVCGDQGISGVDTDIPDPRGALLLAAMPNPFNPQTRFSFNLQQQQAASLTLYDLKGRVVRQLLNEERPAGPNQVAWDGRGDDGRLLPSGLYFGRLETASGSAVTRVVMLK